MIAITVLATFLVPAFSLLEAETARSLTGSQGASVAAAIASPIHAPLPAAIPDSGNLNLDTHSVEIFLGYSYLRAVPTLAAGNRLVWMNGGSASLAYFFTRSIGIVADVGDYTNSQMHFTGAYTGTIDTDQANGGALSYLFGPRIAFHRSGRLSPYVQALFGGIHAGQISIAHCTVHCTLLPEQTAFAMAAGGGLDLRIHRHFAIRLLQAEYLMTRFRSYDTGNSGMQNDIRLSTGIVFRFGGHRNPPLPPMSYSCSVHPATVFAGQTVTVSGIATSLNADKAPVYTWAMQGGTVTGNEDTGTIDTSGQQPGTYTVRGHVSQGSQPGQNADCTASYVVKAFEPPTVSCTADPSTVAAGGASTITAIGVSPQNRSLTYSFESTAGSVSGSGSTATLSTTGAPTGTITVTCHVTDDLAQTSASTTSVTVQAPVAAPAPQTSNLCSVRFDRDSRRPARVDNEAKACLDEVALNMQRNSDAKLAIVGNAVAGEHNSRRLAALRAVNTMRYLVDEKGIDASRIALFTGSQDGKVVSLTLIPDEATFDTTGDTPVQ
uniref:OmpA family protein n=1 Tax=Acidobacterium capsulatum TaxID=33075 RepID=A0A7V4XQR1_9BACT